MDFAVPTDQRIKLKECEKKDKYLDLARELKKSAFVTVSKGLLKGLEDLEDGGWVEIIQTTVLLRTASPGDLGRFDVTQTSVKDHQLTLMWNTLKE